jgi:hypothetical protein
MAAGKPVTIELDATEFALIVGEEDGEMSVRVLGGSEIDDGAEELPSAAEIILALAMRLLRDPEFHDEVLDWYYENQDELGDEA